MGKNSPQTSLNCLESLLKVSKGLPRPNSPLVLSGYKRLPERNWSENGPLDLG